MKPTNPKRTLLATTAVLALAAPVGGALAEGEPAGDYAKAEMMDLDGNRVGTVTVEATPSGELVVSAVFEGMPPGNHALHIHETGACSPDFSAAGGHFAPRGKAHGVLSEDGPHAGDLPNVEIPPSGAKEIQHFVRGVTLSGEGEAVLLDDDGAAFVVHAGPDDYETEPAGDAGRRIACGVLEAV